MQHSNPHCKIARNAKPHGHGASYYTLLFAFTITILFAVIEAIGGHFSHSLALLSDAGHMAADSFSLIFAAIAAWLATRPATLKNTYGLGRTEVLAASLSSIFLILIVLGIGLEAIERLRTPEVVNSTTVMLIGSIGLILNLLIGWILHHGEQTLNTKAAFLHVMSDALGSIAALISGIIIYFTHWMPIDPILSFLICILILIASIRLLRTTLAVLMESTPKHIDLVHMQQSLCRLNGVLAVHDLHVWTLASYQLLLSAHVEIENIENWPKIYEALQQVLHQEFGITHITLQPEPKLFCHHDKPKS